MPTENDTRISVGALLAAGQARLQASSDSGRLDAELLLQHATGIDRARLYARPEQTIGQQEASQYQQYLEARANGTPLAYLTGEREFWSLPLEVNTDTLIPRPETELLVERALCRLPQDTAAEVLELGTGSGAIAAAIATERPDCKLLATDNSVAALATAARNFSRLCPERVRTLHGDWYTALDGQITQPVFDLIVSNPPYIAEHERELTDPELAFEPQSALYAGKDGLDAIDCIVHQAPQYLKRGGWLLIEHGFDQAEQVAGLMTDSGLSSVQCYSDLAGLARVTEGQLR